MISGKLKKFDSTITIVTSCFQVLWKYYHSHKCEVNSRLYTKRYNMTKESIQTKLAIWKTLDYLLYTVGKQNNFQFFVRKKC